MKYSYEISVTAADGETWTTGEIALAKADQRVPVMLQETGVAAVGSAWAGTGGRLPPQAR
jgi:hypothetical protein